jgi:IMP and pyridine-specific 5'-nucleotidase
MLVPSVGLFFTPLNLHDAFLYQDSKRFISWRRFVAPSFNDIRLILNTAQIMSLMAIGPLELVTFDGDVTLYEDGGSLDDNSPVLPALLDLLQNGTKIGIVTAAGYTEAKRYYERLQGLLDAVHTSLTLTPEQKKSLVVMGGESSYLFQFSADSPDRLKLVPREEWLLDEMKMWQESDIAALLDLGELALKDSLKNLRMDGIMIRKERYEYPNCA